MYSTSCKSTGVSYFRPLHVAYLKAGSRIVFRTTLRTWHGDRGQRCRAHERCNYCCIYALAAGWLRWHRSDERVGWKHDEEADERESVGYSDSSDSSELSFSLAVYSFVVVCNHRQNDVVAALKTEPRIALEGDEFHRKLHARKKWPAVNEYYLKNKATYFIIITRKPPVEAALVVTYLQFPIQVCFPCNDHAQLATPTSVTSPTLTCGFNNSNDYYYYCLLRQHKDSTQIGLQ